MEPQHRFVIGVAFFGRRLGLATVVSH
jgi:hypothetical protein